MRINLNTQEPAAVISLSRYVPWRKMGSWVCLGCGGCCSYFKVILRPYEYALLTRTYGREIIGIDSIGNPYIRKVEDKCIFLDRYGLCTLQPLGMKPLACKVWPFVVCIEPKRRYESEKALFAYKGRDYYVYMDRSYPCRGIGAGTREKLQSTITEVIELQRNPAKTQVHSTLNPSSRNSLFRQVIRVI